MSFYADWIKILQNQCHCTIACTIGCNFIFYFICCSLPNKLFQHGISFKSCSYGLLYLLCYLTFPYSVLNWTAISCLWLFDLLHNTLMIDFSSVPNPFMALRNISASWRASKGAAGLMVGVPCNYRL